METPFPYIIICDAKYVCKQPYQKWRRMCIYRISICRIRNTCIDIIVCNTCLDILTMGVWADDVKASSTHFIAQKAND